MSETISNSIRRRREQSEDHPDLLKFLGERPDKKLREIFKFKGDQDERTIKNRTNGMG